MQPIQVYHYRLRQLNGPVVAGFTLPCSTTNNERVSNKAQSVLQEKNLHGTFHVERSIKADTCSENEQDWHDEGINIIR